MKYIYAVKDLAVQAFGQPFFCRARGEALRSFQDETNTEDGKSAIAAHPEHYELYYIGQYNEEAGEIVATPPELVARANDLIRERK